MPAHRQIVSAALLLLLIPVSPGPVSGDEPEPTDRAFVIVSVFPEAPRTWEIMTVTVRSKLWSVDTYGNATLVPNPGYVNVTLHDRVHDVRVASKDAAFRNGTAVAEFVVDPVWSDLWVDVKAEDPVSRLRGELAVRTEFSVSYLLWKIEQDWLASYNEFTARTVAQYAAERSFERGMWALAFLSFFSTLLTVFLRREHRKSRDHALSSMWDRFAEHFPFSLVPEDLWVALEPRRAPPPYKDLADKWVRRRREAAVKRLEDERVGLELAKDRVLKGLLDA